MRTRKVSRRVVVALVALTLVVTSFPLAAFLTAKPAKAAWYNDDWHYRKSILFTHSGAESNVYLNLSGANTLDTSASGRYQSDCGDLRFTDGNGNVLPYFLVSGCGTSTTVVHVLYGTMPAGDQYLYVYYGNPTVANGTTNFDFSTAATGITFGSVGAEETSQGPVAEWKFDEGYGTTTKDSSTNNNVGTLTNNPTWQDPSMCVTGKCLYFNGSNSYVDAGSGNSMQVGTGAMTLSVWFRTSVIPSSYGVLVDTKGCYGNGGGFNLGFNSTNFWADIANGTTQTQIGTSGIPYIDGKWHNAQFTLQRGSPDAGKLYVDGKLVSTNTSTTGWDLTYSNNINIGRGNCGGSTYFNGSIDDVQLYKLARSQTQIQQDYATGLAAMNAQQGNLSNGLVGYWKMDEASWNGTSGEIKDASGSGFNATAGCTGTCTKPTTVTGKFGNAGSFSSANATNAQTPTNLVLSQTQGRAASFWLYPNSAESWSFVMIVNTSNDLGSIMYQGTSGNLASRMCINDANSYVTPVVNQWNFVTFSYDPVTHKDRAYLNGSLVRTVDRTGQMCGAYTSQPMEFGGFPGDTTHSFDGNMDEVRYYGRNITSSEVQQLYNFGPPPVAAYNFEEGSGNNFYDITGNGFDANSNQTPRVLGKYGMGISVYPYVNLLKSAITTTPPPNITMSAWVKPAVLGGNITGFDGSAYILGLNTSGGIYFRVYDGTAYTDVNSSNVLSSANLNKWSYVTATYDDATVRFYLNGNLVSTSTATRLPSSTAAKICIGYCGNGYFSGNIDEAKLYNYVRSPQQISADMNGTASALDNPVGWWKMDEGQGTTAHDSTPNNNFATLTNGASWSNAGHYQGALSLAGGTQYATINNPASGALDFGSSGDFTISSWVNTTNVTNGPFIVDKRHSFGGVNAGYSFMLLTSGRPALRLADGTQVVEYDSSSGNVADGKWHYIAVSVSRANTTRFYIDGQQVGTASVSVIGNITTSNPLFLGTKDATSSNALTGMLDDVKLWGAALTPQDILADYNRAGAIKVGSAGTENVTTKSGATGTQPSNSKNSEYCVPGDTSSCAAPTAEWKFEEGSGTSVKDSSGGGDDGTWSGSGNHWVPGKIGTAATFNGVDDVISTAHNAGVVVSTGSFTLETWFKVPSLPSSQQYLVDTKYCGSNSAGYYLALNNTYIVGVIANGTSQFGLSTAAAAYADNKWHHVAFIVQRGSPDTYYTYIDGQLAKSQTFASTGWDLTSANNLTIGAGNCASSSFAGSLDQMRLYQYVRTPAQVAWDFNKGGPVAWYKMDECSGSTVHSSTNPYNAALNGTITIGATGTQTAIGTCQASGTAWGNGANGKRGGSLNFDGTDDGVSMGSYNLSPVYSLSAWMKTSGYTGNWQPIVRINNAAQASLYIYDTGGYHNIMFYTGGTGWFVGPVAQINQWYHVVGTYDGTTKRLYVNGQYIGSAAAANTGGSGPFTIGSDTYSQWFRGQIDDVQIFNYALTPTQISTLYNGGSVYWGQ